MTLDDVLQELIQTLSSEGDDSISWDQVREWPSGAMEIFQNAGWMKPKVPAKSVVCPGCEENCFMPVHVFPPVQGKFLQAYVACDKRDDMGRIPIPPDYLQQWQVTEKQVAEWIARELGLRGKPKKNKEPGTIRIGSVQGKKRTNLLKLTITEQASLMASGHSLPLIEVVYLKGNLIEIDKTAIINLIDRLPTSNSYTPSIARREANKLNKQDMYKSWQKAYRQLKKANPEKPDNWCALKIAGMPIAQGKSSETIRKNMKN